jgi:hypothetical protein
MWESSKNAIVGFLFAENKRPSGQDNYKGETGLSPMVVQTVLFAEVLARSGARPPCSREGARRCMKFKGLPRDVSGGLFVTSMVTAALVEFSLRGGR